MIKKIFVFLRRKFMGQNPYNQYKKSAIQTASQGKLILMMYEGAIRFINVAIENMPEKRYDIVNKNIIKAQDIITELMLALNMEQGGEIAKNLYSLYEYMNRRLVESNLKKDPNIASEVIKLLTELKSAWDIAVKKTNEMQQSKFVQPQMQQQSTDYQPPDKNIPGGTLNISG
ncbi:MAG TPA: flagellar export chaperone FliS [bacterium]|nr:flagellar export chaperone FliS [bacterium]